MHENSRFEVHATTPCVSWGADVPASIVFYYYYYQAKVPDRNEQQKEDGDGDAATGAGYKKT